MKIKDIINEQGFWSSFGKALLPSALRKVADTDQPTGEPSDDQLIKKTGEMFGLAPDAEKVYNKIKQKGQRSPAQLQDFYKELMKKGWETPYQRSQSDQEKRAAEKEENLRKQLALQTSKQARKAVLPPNTTNTKQTKSSAQIPTAADIPTGQRIRVTNPQGNATFYKYPGGKWTDEFGTAMPRSAHGALDQFADAGGRMEQIPAATKTAYQGRGGRRGR